MPVTPEEPPVSAAERRCRDQGFNFCDTSKEEADYRMAVLAERHRQQEARHLSEIRWELRQRMSNT